MKFRTVIVTATAAAAALSFAAVGSAAAQTLGHPAQRMAASSSQVTGSRLVKALLPGSAFGGNFTRYQSAISTGGKLSSTRVRQTPASLSCGSLVDHNYVSNWGNTAGASVIYVNQAWQGSWPFTQYSVSQWVAQFPSGHAASTFFSQAYSKYSGCRNFSVANPTDTTPGGGSYAVSDGSARKVSVNGHQAFWVSELWAPSNAGGEVQDVEILFAVSGTNVYYLWEDTGTNDEPSPSLMSDLIHRVQSLY
jgi:hypothetical protein